MENIDEKYTRAFNARYMTFEDIAKSFIKSDNFIGIIKNEHSILTGSRGCGKTTLLKMLHPKALNAWNNKDGIQIKNEIPFTGIYIPADRQWKSQLDTFETKFAENKGFVENIFRGVVNANILIAICSTFDALLEINNIESGFEIDLCKKLIDCWEIPKPLPPNLADIVIKIRCMVKDFNSIINKNSITDELPKLCYNNFVDLISVAIDCFESINNSKEYKNIEYKNRWALCFDELEIAPKFLQELIINQNLRSLSDQRLIFKITTTPSLNLSNHDFSGLNPSELDDFTELKLWVYDNRSQKQWRSFCESYLKSSLETKFNDKIIDIKVLLGDHDYINGLKAGEPYEYSKLKSKNNTEFEEGGIMWYVMKKLQYFDDSFRDFLDRKDINPFNPIPKNREQEASIHRKIKPIVLYRYYFTEKSNRKDKRVKLRSRNINTLNHGKDYIYDISDGNPRAFANIVNEIIKQVQFSNDKRNKNIDIPSQTRIIESFSINYSYKRIINYPKNIIKNSDLLLYEIVDKIGDYFFNRLVLSDFTADPTILFYIDSSDTELENFIDIALESGAILKIEEEIPKKGVRKAHDVYRLSYSLYPKYRLPKVNYNPIPLRNILNSQKNNKKPIINQIPYPSLFPNLTENEN